MTLTMPGGVDSNSRGDGATAEEQPLSPWFEDYTVMSAFLRRPRSGVMPMLVCEGVLRGGGAGRGRREG